VEYLAAVQFPSAVGTLPCTIFLAKKKMSMLQARPAPRRLPPACGRVLSKFAG
jgi:putative ATPase